MENKTVDAIRKFNRDYTVTMGFLNNKYIENFSVIEARILFELKNSTDCAQNHLVKVLNIDKSYLSRIIKRFEKDGLVIKNINKDDLRTQHLKLTDKGFETVCYLIKIINDEIKNMISSLDNKECEELCRALDTVIKYLHRG